jgi:hypothetical protein
MLNWSPWNFLRTVFDSDIFNTKVVNKKEIELDGMPFMVPEARGGSHFVVTFNNKAEPKETVD